MILNPPHINIETFLFYAMNMTNNDVDMNDNKKTYNIPEHFVQTNDPMVMST